MAMTNLEALRAQCKLICNTCYVDSDVLQLALHNAGIEADGEAAVKDPAIIREAIVIVKGWVETSRSESGISASIDAAAIRNSIIFWCGEAGLDASEFVDDTITLDSGADLW